jgi:hypothetical protein
MKSFIIRATCTLAIALAPVSIGTASAQSNQNYLKDRCAQLLGYYAYYGIDRRENSDGVKNGVWVAATADCEKGRYEEGIAELERLMRDKNMPVVSADMMSTPDGSVSPIPHSVAHAP